VRITRGMFNMIYDEAETACLIGHEIGHAAIHQKNQEEKPLISKEDKVDVAGSVADIVLADSKYKRIVKKQQKEMLTTSWSRNQEKEADKYGAELAAKAGYDPYAFCDLFERLASRVDLDFVYRFQKLEGSHPALDDRAKSLREYLKKKGYKEGEGKRNRQQYLDGMADLHAMRTGEDSKDNKKIRKGIDEQGKKDLKRLDEIFKEVESLRKSNKSISMSRFLEIMDEISVICQKYGVTAEDIFGGIDSGSDASFMEESITQDSPFWEMLKSIKDAVVGKVSNILGVLGRVAIGSTPIIGDVIDAYELITGKDFFTGEKLTNLERALSAFGLLVGSAATWRAIANGFDNELAKFVGRVPAKNITEARTMLKSSVKDVEVVGDWKKVNSKTANKAFEIDTLPYRSGMRAYEGVTKNNEVFYRVFSKGNIESTWLIRFDPKGMDAKYLQEILALPKTPTHIAKVTVPAGTKIRTGSSGAIKDWGKGGSVQWEIIKEKSTSFKDLKIIFEQIGKL
jgi:Putative Zn-dependent protease